MWLVDRGLLSVQPDGRKGLKPPALGPSIPSTGPDARGTEEGKGPTQSSSPGLGARSLTHLLGVPGGRHVPAGCPLVARGLSVMALPVCMEWLPGKCHITHADPAGEGETARSERASPSATGRE